MITLVNVLFSWMLIVGTLRWSIVDLQHSQIHHEIFKKEKWKGELIAETLSTLFCTHTLVDYKISHYKHHNKRFTFTLEDDDYKLLLSLGFKPGMSVQELKRHFYYCFISPSFHWYMFVSRLSSNLGLGTSKTGNCRRCASIIWLLFLAYLTIFVSFHMALIAYIIPVIFIANIAALGQFATEHAWLADNNQSWGRFIGEELPNSYQGQAVWIAKLLFIWIPQRFIWVPGSLSQHDAHHIAGSKFDPFNSVYSRAALVGKGKVMTETFGFDAALTRAMTSISQATPII